MLKKHDYMKSASVEIDIELHEPKTAQSLTETTPLDTIILSWNTMPDGVNLGLEAYDRLADDLERHIQNSHPYLGNVEWREFGYFTDDDKKTVMGFRLSFQSDFKLRHWVFGQFTHVYNRQFVGDPKKAFLPF